MTEPTTPPLLAVLDVGTTLDDAGERWPTAVIDATSHPEVADLARVHAVEGIGDISTEAALVPIDDAAGDVDHLLLVGVAITQPVRAAFAVAFSLPVHREVLDDAATRGQLVLATTDPERADADRPLWLAIDIDPALFASVLPG